MDTLRVSKNDTLDARGLALLQMQKNYLSTPAEEEMYTELRNRHRFYQEISKDGTKAKNRLKRALQDTFSEFENVFNGDNMAFYELVKVVPMQILFEIYLLNKLWNLYRIIWLVNYLK